MENEKINEKTKYSHRGPIDMNTIPIADTNWAIFEFANGSNGLEKSLRAMWQRNLKTHACSAGSDSPYDIAYITMQEDVDIFSYLSTTTLNDDLIEIDYEDNRETIRFAGSKGIREGAILQFVRDIESGKKKNSDLVEEKIGKPFNEEWLREAQYYFIHKTIEEAAPKKLIKKIR